MKTIGFIGLGTMGMPMAANLIRRGYPVTVYNRTPGKASELIELGADEAATPREAVKSADVVITMVSHDAAIEDVYYGEDGVLAGLKPGTAVLDSSTISPALVRRLAEDVAARFADFLDAPVTGSKPAAEDGSLVFMVGGKRAVMEDVRPVLLAMGRDIIHMGANGSGATAKLAHNTIAAINAAGLAEGMAIAAKGGIDAESFLRLVQSGGAASKQADLKGLKIINEDYSVQFALALMLKDLKLSAAMSDGLQVPAPLLGAAKALFQGAETAGHGGEDMAAIAKLYESWIGRRIGEPQPAAGELTADDERSSADRADAVSERRRSVRVAVEIPVMMSIYQWQQEGSFSGQSIEGFLRDLSDNGLQIASRSPLAKDMFVVIHFLEESSLPPMTARIIRIERSGEMFNYGCMLSALPPYQRLQLEAYIESKRSQ